MNKKGNSSFSRRGFIGATATALAGFSIIPAHAVSGLRHIPPSDKLNIAGIGVGGKGRVNLRNMPGQNIVALCDVDWDYADGVFKTYPDARRWKDFREMLEKQKDIEAVVIATPDHTHAVQAMMAMQLGKHVYCQKPLTHTVWEAREMTKAAKRYRVATQMGNEGHSNDEVRMVTEIIHAGIIGDVYEVHATTNRPIWPQGLHRPEEEHKVPKTLDWDLFLGTASYRPYNEAYHPWSWRAWWDYGTGALGDMGCHVLDVPFYSLNLKYPVKVQSSSTLVNTESAPQASRVEFTFPARKNLPYCAMPELKLVWHDGGLTPKRYEDLPEGIALDQVNLYIGTKGKLISANYGSDFKVIVDDFKSPLQTIERIPDHPLGGGRHEMDWVRACKEDADSRKEACSNFEYSGPLSEMVLMGNLSIRLQDLRKELEWDGETMKFKNIGPAEEINLIKSHIYKKVDKQPRFMTDREKVNALEFAGELIKHNYREGWGW
ncbi:MAG: Gfo/Idh/MocA family oxidoreductase [Prolixibacteraceae bacterium]|nr:Gfo/Idh/MocA family oxidoreductase [Prolixibacteraceae bacterium]